MKTNHSIILVLVLVLFSTPTFAQFNFGMRHGAAGTTFSGTGDIYDNANIAWSYTAGAFFSIPLTESLEIQPELNYMRKGRSKETSELNTLLETDFMIHYLQVPVLFQYRNTEILCQSGSVFYLNAGPYTAFAVNKQTRESSPNSEELLLAVDESDNIDWGATFGIGFQTPIRNNDVRFDLRYDMGFSEIEAQPEDYRTKAVSLTIGILL